MPAWALSNGEAMADHHAPEAAVRYVGTDGQVGRGVPHLVVGVCLTWLICLGLIESRALAVVVASAVSVVGALAWWFLLWPIEHISVVGSLLTAEGRHGRTETDLANLVDVRAKWIPYSGTWIVIETSRGTTEILKSRSNRAQLLAIGEAIRASNPARRLAPRAARALGLF
ncbi:hypothetical protein ACPPVS_16545 [Cellulomonas sp. McL0617]|uniref:hypothetical protein n=1 Tax=Cellulomonas sp. McL0617 TaxID=3415675 RepID=UPI003CE9C18A